MNIKTVTLLVAMTAATSNAASVVVAGTGLPGGSEWEFSGTGITLIDSAIENTSDPAVFAFADPATGVSFTVSVAPSAPADPLNPASGTWSIAITNGLGVIGVGTGTINPSESIDISFSDVVGVLGPVTISDPVGGATLSTSGNSIVGSGDRLQGFTVNFTAIPEPSTGLLAGLAGLALVARRRR